jgi:hypothetical protein
MSIDDFDNGAPDNRPTERWTRLADAARFDARRKVWRACGLEDDPPADDAAIGAAILDVRWRRLGNVPFTDGLVERLEIEQTRVRELEREVANLRAERLNAREGVLDQVWRALPFAEIQGLEIEVPDPHLRAANPATLCAEILGLGRLVERRTLEAGSQSIVLPEVPELLSPAPEDCPVCAAKGRTLVLDAGTRLCGACRHVWDLPQAAPIGEDILEHELGNALPPLRSRVDALARRRLATREEIVELIAHVGIVVDRVASLPRRLARTSPSWREDWDAALDEIWRVFTAESPRGDRDALQIAEALVEYGRKRERSSVWSKLRLTGDPPANFEHVVAQALDQLVQRRLEQLKHYEAEEPTPIPGMPVLTIEQRLEETRTRARHDALMDVIRAAGVVLGGPLTPEAVVQAVRGADCTELAEVRRALEARDGESAFAALGRSRDVAVQAHSVAIGLELAEIYGCLTGAAAPAGWNLAKLRQECRDAARSASTDAYRQGRAWLTDLYHTMSGERPSKQTSAEDLFARCRTMAQMFAETEPEQHDEVEVAMTSGLVLRSADLARGVAALEEAGPVEVTRYLRLDDAYYRQTDAPAYSLDEEHEHQLAAAAAEVLDARDGAGYLDVLRQVGGATHERPPAVRIEFGNMIVPGETVVLADPRAVRQDVVRFLHPVLANLREAAGLPPLDVQPVHQHELHNALHDVAMDIALSYKDALWLAAWSAQRFGTIEYLEGRLAERGGRGLDLVSLLAAWAGYWRERVSAEAGAKIEEFADKLRARATSD